MLSVGACAVSSNLIAQQPYHVIDQWKIGGETGWDLLVVDPDVHLLYIAHGPRVEVIDTNTGKKVGAVTGMKMPFGVALDPAGKYGYVTDGGANTVVVFDRASLATVATIPAGTNPDGIIFEPVTQTVWAFNARSSNASVIDPASKKVVATVALPGNPEFPAVDGKGIIYLTIVDKHEIVRIEAKSKKVVAEFPVGCTNPSALAFDVSGHWLFAACEGKKLSVIDSETGKLIANPEIGDGPDGAAWSATHNLAFVTSGDGILSVVNTGMKGYPTIGKLTTQKGSRTMTYDAAKDRIYIPAIDFGPLPKPTAQNPHPKAGELTDTFKVLVIGR